MASSVLGKRTRAAYDSPSVSRAKRTRPFVIASDNDENANPFITSKAPATPKKPRTPSASRAAAQASVYNTARGLFNASSGKLVGRDKERTELDAFISSRVGAYKPGCLYISGPPGTGKSALVTEYCETLDASHLKKSYVNSVSVKNAAGVLAKLLEDFGEGDVLQGSEAEALQEVFHRKRISHLVILDEIDHLLDGDLQLLYKLFQWSIQKSSNLILVGIANALDFTDRFLPRLKSKGLKPQLLPIMPYSDAQISAIVISKLQSLLPADSTTCSGYVPIIHPTAITFAAKKVAAQTGDLRKAFSICLRAIDLIEIETRAKATESTPSPSPVKTPLMENMNLSSPRRPLVSPTKSPKKPISPALKGSLAHLTAETAPRATIAHMARVTTAVFSNGTTQRLGGLNLQQKAVLCALLAVEAKHKRRIDSPFAAAAAAMATADAPSHEPRTPSKSANLAPTVKSLFDTYAALCRRDNVLHPLSATEFRDVVASLDTMGLVAWADGRNSSFTPSRGTPTRTPGQATPSRRGRKAAFGGPIAEEKRVVSSVGMKEMRGALTGVGADILLRLLDGEDF